MSLSKLALAAAVVCLLSACATVQSYVDPQFEHATFQTVHPMAQPIPVAVSVQWKNNGVLQPTAAAGVTDEVKEVLRRTGVFVPVSSTPGAYKATITVTGDDMDDAHAAHSAGFAAGVSLGSSGSVVQDNYVFTFKYTDGKHDYQNQYKHLVYSTVGSARPPVSGTPLTASGATRQVIQDVTLNFVQDMQQKGLLAPNP